MIRDIINYLDNNTELQSLLNATSIDSKIYPNQSVQRREYPYVIYTISSQGSLDENINESTVNFNCISNIFSEAEAISNKIKELLDVQDKIRNVLNDSDSNYYYWSKHNGGTDYKEKEQNIFHVVSIFEFKYGRYDFLLQENGYYLLLETGGKIII